MKFGNTDGKDFVELNDFQHKAGQSDKIHHDSICFLEIAEERVTSYRRINLVGLSDADAADYGNWREWSLLRWRFCDR
jgi:hypothetical protein